MAGRFGKMPIRIWLEPEFQELKTSEKFLVLYFLSSPHRRIGGIFRVNFDVIKEETGLSKKTIKKALKVLESKNFVKFCGKNSILWEKISSEDYQNFTRPQLKGLIRNLNELPKSPIITEFLDSLPEGIHEDIQLLLAEGLQDRVYGEYINRERKINKNIDNNGASVDHDKIMKLMRLVEAKRAKKMRNISTA